MLRISLNLENLETYASYVEKYTYWNAFEISIVKIKTFLFVKIFMRFKRFSNSKQQHNKKILFQKVNFVDKFCVEIFNRLNRHFLFMLLGNLQCCQPQTYKIPLSIDLVHTSHCTFCDCVCVAVTSGGVFLLL